MIIRSELSGIRRYITTKTFRLEVNALKYLRISVTAAFIVSLCLYAVFHFLEQRKDTTYPVITVDSEVMDVELDVDEAGLLKGVTAYDEKDGDITSKIMIESISKFTEDGVSIVTYAVCDNDNHAASAQRKIRFKDYKEPTFVIEKPLVFGLDEDVDILSCIGAYDVIDGDISDRVIITSTEYNTNEVGVFEISLKATNSMGDTIYMDVPVYIEDRSLSAPEVVLKEYLVYTKVGEEIDLVDYLVSSTDKYNQPTNVIIDTNYDPDKPGSYQAHYETTDGEGREGHAVMTIIVEG